MEHSELPVEATKTPPKNTTSTILSGAGNGMMLGIIPFAAIELYSKIVLKKEPPRKALVASAFATVAGAVIGAVYGAKEAKEINRYRESVTREIAALRTQTEANQATIDSWTEKHAAKHSAHHEPTR
jgi:hypothetical protein